MEFQTEEELQKIKEETQKIFDNADKQREIKRFLEDSLYKIAEEKECFCTWVIRYPVYNEEKGFEFTIEVTSEDKTHKTNKLFYVGYDWEEEKGILKEIVLYLLRPLQEKQEK